MCIPVSKTCVACLNGAAFCRIHVRPRCLAFSARPSHCFSHTQVMALEENVEEFGLPYFGMASVCLLWLLCVFFCRVFSVHSSTFLKKPYLLGRVLVHTSLFAAAALCLFPCLFRSCLFGSLQYFLLTTRFQKRRHTHSNRHCRPRRGPAGRPRARDDPPPRSGERVEGASSPALQRTRSDRRAR